MPGIHDGHRERLRQRFLTEGLENFQPHEVLELMLFYSIPRCNTSELAHALLNAFGNDFAAVLDAPVEALTQVKGISVRSATLISLFSQVVRRYQKEKNKPPQIMNTTEQFTKLLLPKMSYLPTEIVMMVSLDTRFKVLDCSVVAEGNVNTSEFALRNMLQRALLFNAAYVVLAHNHPSERAYPSKTDIATTMQLMRSLKTADILLWDHIIIGGNEYFSLRDSENWGDFFHDYSPPPEIGKK